MDINIIAGKCSDINNDYIFEKLKHRDKTKRHTIIAPDRCLFSLEQRIFDELKESCFFDINVISFTKLSKQILSKVNNNKNILTKQSGVALVKKLLKENESSLLTFKKASSFMGFATTLFETICLYKSCGITPNDIFTDESNTYANLKQKDIKTIYMAYENYLQNDYTDSFNQLQLFADLIDKNSFKNTIFYFVEFDDFTYLMYNIIAKLCRFSDGAYLCCSYGKDNINSNIYSNKVYYDLIDLFKYNGLEYKINKLESYNDENKNLLLNNLLAYEPVKSSRENDKIIVHSFENMADEIKYIIADIYSLVLKEKLDFSKVAVVLPSILEYKNLLVKELKLYGIPYYIDENEILVNNAFIRLLFSICRVLFNDYNLSDFCSILKSPILNFNNESVLDYDNYLKRIGAVGNMCINSNKTQDIELIGFFDFLLKLKQEIKEEMSWESSLNIILQVYDYLISRNEKYLSNLTALEKRIYTQVLSKFESINKDFLGIFKDTKSSFKEFLETYISYFETTNISLPPITSNTLFIADSSASYLSKVDYIYILGCNEGKLPKYKLDNGLVTDDEIARLPNANKINPTIAMLNNRKQFRLFELVFKANKRLTLSYLTSNSEGKLFPNNLIVSLQKIFDIKVNNGSVALDLINKSFYDLDINNIVFNNLTPNIATLNILKLVKNWEVYSKNQNYRILLNSLTKSIENKKIINLIENNNSKNQYENLNDVNMFKDNSTSVSQIECFYNCPYKHYVRYGLRLKNQLDYKLKPNDVGTIIHEVLKTTIPFMLKNIDNIDDIIKKAEQELKLVLKRDEYSEIANNSTNAYIVKSLYREIARVCIALREQILSSSYKPKYYEYCFNDDDLKIKDIKIKGAIDRVDIFDDKFIILDYKTGDNSFSNYNDVYSGKKLQLLVYAKSFANKTKLKPAGAFYLPLSNGFGDEEYNYRLNGVMLKNEDNIIAMDNNLAGEGYKSKVVNLKTTSNGKIYASNYYKNLCLSEEDFEYLLNFSISQVDKAINNILQGEITPRPIVDGQKSACTYCDYKALCNYLNTNDNEVITVENIDKLKNLGEENGRI